MNFENQISESVRGLEHKAKIEVEPGLDVFIPEEFRQDPIGYFEDKGRNIKSGDIIRDEMGRIREDPTIVKELPVWTASDGQELRTVGKRINIGKGKIGESGDPFYEYEIMETVASVGLPTPRPVAKIEQGGEYLIIMEKIRGIGWYEKDKLEERGFSNEDIRDLQQQAEKMTEELKQRFSEAGIVRGWKLKDMVFDIDMKEKRIKTVTPTDWERTKIDGQKLEEYRRKIRIDSL